MSFEPKTAFNDLSLLPPAGIELESKEVLKKCILARSLLGELKEAGKRIPKQTILINTMSLLEAQASSEIENIVTSTDKLFQFNNAEDKADASTKEALQYKRALWLGFERIGQRPISTSLAEEICSVIKAQKMSVRKVPGVKLVNPSTQEVIYTPPEGETLLRDKLRNWENFLNTEPELDPLIRMAILHYQFEAIHPFTDGNGRVGRVLNILFLIQEKLLESPILYLSRYIIQNKADYYKKLLKVTQDQAWQEWIIYILEAVISTSRWAKKKIENIESLMATAKEELKSSLPKIYSYELVELTFMQPYCRIQNLVEAGLAKRQTASVYLKELCAIGMLEERKVGREKLYINPRFLKLLSV